MTQLIWFNISVLFSALCAGWAVQVGPGVGRTVLVFLAVHGALWSIYRAMLAVKIEGSKSNANYQRHRY